MSGSQRIVIVATAGWLLGSACRQPAVQAPGDSRAESEAAIKAADVAASAAAAARDVDKLAAFYTEDTSFMPPNAPPEAGSRTAAASG